MIWNMEELEKMAEPKEPTGEAFVDAYNLGYSAGVARMLPVVKEADSDRSNEWHKSWNLNKENEELKAVNERMWKMLTKKQRKEFKKVAEQ